MARRLGTSRCSVILPKEIRRGANALEELVVFAGREDAKMRPSEDRWCGGRFACSPTGPGRKRPNMDASQQGCSRKTAQTSSVAERLTAAKSPPASNRKAPLTSENPEVKAPRHWPEPLGGDPRGRSHVATLAVASAEGVAVSACLEPGHPVKGCRIGASVFDRTVADLPDGLLPKRAICPLRRRLIGTTSRKLWPQSGRETTVSGKLCRSSAA